MKDLQEKLEDWPRCSGLLLDDDDSDVMSLYGDKVILEKKREMKMGHCERGF
jgi:hypothetical protein